MPFLITLFCNGFVCFLQVVFVSTSRSQRRPRKTSTENSNFNIPITLVFGDVEFPDDVSETDDPFKVKFSIKVRYFKLKIKETVGLKFIENLGKNKELSKELTLSTFLRS